MSPTPQNKGAQHDAALAHSRGAPGPYRHVRFWPLADVRHCTANVRFRVKRTCNQFLFAVIPNISGEFPLASDSLPHDKIFP